VDDEVVGRIVERLAKEGISVWIDKALRAGDVWEDEIVNAISKSSAVLFFVGGEISRWRFRELQLAMERRSLIPILLPGTSFSAMPPELQKYNAAVIDSSSPEQFERSVARLVDDVAHFLQTKEQKASAPIDPDDPQSGRWGRAPVRNGRELSASVRPVSDDFFEVTLEVRSTGSTPLGAEVEFHLHPTFAKAVETVPIVDGRAVLKLLCWGAFMVGAVTDNGQTTLELDLSANKTFPKKFIEH
jgi:hypothetical protein